MPLNECRMSDLRERTCRLRHWARASLRRLQLIVHMLHHDLAEDLARLNVLQADVGIDRGLHIAMTEDASDKFVFARPGAGG